MSKCDRCTLHKSARIVCMPCQGLADNGLMLVGEAPGAVEDQQGVPFVGDAGRLLNRVLRRIGVERSECAVVNAGRCRPPGNRAPVALEIAACRSYLVEDILRLKPKVVVPMGNTALLSILGLKKITKIRGAVLQSPEFPGVYFVPTIHPASVLRRYEDAAFLEHDLAKAWKICQEGWKQMEVDYQVCRSLSDVGVALRDVEDTMVDYISVDTETTGFNYWTDKIICVSLSNREGTGWLIPIYGFKMAEIWTPEELLQLVAMLKTFLESDLPKALQNEVFDRLMFRGNWGIELNNVVVDTMLLHHVVDENLPHSLEVIESLYTDIDPYKSDFSKALPRGGTYADVPTKLLWKYACGDADGTYRGARRLVALAEADGVKETHDRIMLPLCKVLADAEWHGIQVDREKLEQLHEDHKQKKEALLADIFTLAQGEFNPDSSKQVGRVLFDKLGLPVVKTTGAGNRSVDAEVMKQLRGKHPIIERLSELSFIHHDMKTYLKGKNDKSGLLKYMYEDGRVHVRWMQHRAVTGRLSSVDPNAQAIKKHGPFRPLFCATPGWVWISADYKSMEAYVAGYVAPDERMIQMHKSGEDVHRLVASQMFKCALEEVQKSQREQAKGVVFGLNYGRAEFSLAAEFHISVEAAKKYIASYFALFEGIKKLFDRTRKMVDGPHAVQTPFKRKRHFNAVADLKEALKEGFFSQRAAGDAKRALGETYRQAQNMTIQSPASDMLGLACIRIHERLPAYHMKGQLLISQHDAWHGECPEEELEDTLAIVKEELERPVPEMHDASFEVDFQIGRFWSDNSITVKGIN